MSKNPIETFVNDQTTVGATSTLVLAANKDRAYLYIVNTSDEAVYLGLGAAAVDQKGIKLAAAGNPGTIFVMDADAICQGAIYAICASGSKVIAYSEGSDVA